MPPGSEPASGSVRPKQPIHSPDGELRQIFLALLLRAIGMDRIHHQRRLHAHHRAVAGIDALDLARHQAVGHIAGAEPAIFLGNGDAEQARPRPSRGRSPDRSFPRDRPPRCAARACRRQSLPPRRGSSARPRISWSSIRNGSFQTKEAAAAALVSMFMAISGFLESGRSLDPSAAATGIGSERRSMAQIAQMQRELQNGADNHCPGICVAARSRCKGQSYAAR